MAADDHLFVSLRGRRLHRTAISHTFVALLAAAVTTTLLIAAAPAAQAQPSRSGDFPRYDHIFMITEENHGFQDIIGNPAAPTLNNLARTYGLATLDVGDALNMVGPLGVGFTIDPACKHIVVLGRGVGLATLAPISQLAGERGIGVTAILSARSAEFVMADDLFGRVGEVIAVLDTDGTSAVEHVEAILERLIVNRRADAFYTCGSNRLLQLMKRVGKAHGIPGQVAMEQVMACGLGSCYVCVRTFEVDGKKELRRVCIEGPVFDLQEAVGW